MAAAKKTFKDNPALAFITPPAGNTDNTQQADNTHSKPKAKTGKKESKTRRVNLLLQPSTMEGITKIAFLQRTSANDLINTILKQYISDHPDEIQKYNSIFTKENET